MGIASPTVRRFRPRSRTRDARVVLPLIADVACGSEATCPDVLWALTGVAHRLGREGLYQMLRMDADTSDAENGPLDAFMDQLFRYSQKKVEEHFESFYDIGARRIVLAEEPQRCTH